MTRWDYDVVIVGGRVAGAATAMLLAREGLRVLVLDRDREGSDTVSTHALMRGGVLQLSRWGLLDRIRAAGTPAVRRTVFHYESGDVRVTLKPSAGVDALYAPRRTVLDAVLVEAARAAGAEVRFGERVTSLIRQGDAVGGVVIGDGTRGRQVRAPLTIGADGIGSVVAAAVGAPVVRRGTSVAAALYAYVDGLEPEGYEWYYGRNTAAGFIPTNDDQVCVFAGTSARVFRAMSGAAPQRFRELLQTASPQVAARVGAATRVGRLRGFPGRAGYLRTASGPGWALVGDAGYFKDPLSTHGITDALRDAELLARAATESATSGGRPGVVPAVYQQERDRLSARLFQVTDRIAGCDWDERTLRRHLLELSSAMSDEVEALLALPDGRNAPKRPAMA